MKRIGIGAVGEDGFTLVELMIVICILAILVSIALLSVTFTRARAQEAGCKSNLRTMEGIVTQYEAANGKLPPNLDTLVAEGYLRKMPQCEKSDYGYDSATGEVSCPNGHKL
ncbi:MAG: prepilin-type N-terminal cleavage/methylation domain-containing protein [Actinobacteria bacterium]|nr:prepilin-type N-terminal cleavage/methylation domain-containing protein [Actinomycetota bacterium]